MPTKQSGLHSSILTSFLKTKTFLTTTSTNLENIYRLDNISHN